MNVQRTGHVRLGGPAAMTGGLLLLVGTFVFHVGHPLLYYLGFPVRDLTVLYVFYGVSSAVALVLVPVGMAGFHVLQGHSYGREGQNPTAPMATSERDAGRRTFLQPQATRKIVGDTPGLRVYPLDLIRSPRPLCFRRPDASSASVVRRGWLAI